MHVDQVAISIDTNGKWEEMKVDIEQWTETTKFPVPHYWPTGVPFYVMQGDQNTGEFFLRLEVEPEACLGRWPLHGRPTQQWEQLSLTHVKYEWEDSSHRWALLVKMPLSVEQLAAIKASMSPE